MDILHAHGAARSATVRTMSLGFRWTVRAVTVAVVTTTLLVPTLTPAGAQEMGSIPTDLAFSSLTPQAGNPTGVAFTYTSVSQWRSTNVELTMPSWSALLPFTSTGTGSCPTNVTVSAKARAGGGPVTFSQCSLVQEAGAAKFSVVVNSPKGLDGPVSVALPMGMLRNPIAPGSYAVRLAEQSNAGWVGLSQWVPVGVPSDFTLDLADPEPGDLTSATATYTSASSWGQTNITLALPGFSAQNTFSSTGQAGCPAGITVTGTPATATVTECSWTQIYNSNSGTTLNNTAVFSAVINSPNLGLTGPITIAFADGMLRNPPGAGQYVTRLSEQANAGAVSMNWWVGVGVPTNLSATINSSTFGATTGAVITYDSASDWANTNVVVTFPGWTVLKPVANTGQRPCPSAVRVTATPRTTTIAQCSLTQQGAGATVSLVLRSPGVGLQGQVRIALADGLLRNPSSGAVASIRLAEQSGAGWVGLSTPIVLNTAR